MAILKRDPTEKPRLDLAGPAGNAFALLGLAREYGKQLRFPPEKIKQIQDDMRAGDYDNLIKVFDEHFGEFVDLVLPPSNKDEAQAPPASSARKPRA